MTGQIYITGANLRVKGLLRTFAVLALCMLSVFILPSCKKEQSDATTDSEYEIHETYERGPLTVSLKASRREITIAEQVELVLEASVDEDYEVELPAFGEKIEDFGILDYETSPPKLVGEGRIVTRRTYKLEPFLSGEYKIPPMAFYFWHRTVEEPRAHKLETEEQKITVKSILPEAMSELEIKGIAAPVDIPRSTQVSLFLAVGAGVLIVGGLLTLLFWRRRRSKVSEEIMLPAHVIALRQLEEVLAEELIKRGLVKLFYIRVSNILRYYLENRFGLRAPESTTEEFLVELGSSSVLQPTHKELLKAFLTHCDLVKFAKLHPSDEEVQRTLDTCRDLIDTTKKTEETAALTTAMS